MIKKLVSTCLKEQSIKQSMTQYISLFGVTLRQRRKNNYVGNSHQRRVEKRKRKRVLNDYLAEIKKILE